SVENVSTLSYPALSRVSSCHLCRVLSPWIAGTSPAMTIGRDSLDFSAGSIKKMAPNSSKGSIRIGGSIIDRSLPRRHALRFQEGRSVIAAHARLFRNQTGIGFKGERTSNGDCQEHDLPVVRQGRRGCGP